MRRSPPFALLVTALVVAACAEHPFDPAADLDMGPALSETPAAALAASPADVGYYRITASAGAANQVGPITAAGHTAVQLTNLTAADLAGIDVLFIDNPSNFSYGGGGGEFTANLANIAAWVHAGGVMVFHDRFVGPAETVLPGGATFNIIRDFSDPTNIDVRDASTLVTNGPGGVVTNATLDGGNFSSHGFAVAGSLPGTSALILTRTDPDELVTFSYCFGAGGVLYSSIPLDFYLSGGGAAGVRSNMVNIYAPNTVAYGAEGFCDTTPPEISVSVTPDALWPPNHKMVDIEATVTVSDNVSAPADILVELVSVVSSEPDDAPGDGDGMTTNDVQGADTGTDDRSFQVRAERQGGGPGRVYTVTYRATDEAGNTAEASAEIVVPHDRRK